MSLPAYLADTTGRVRWQNQAALALTGNNHGRPFFMNVAPEYRHRAEASFRRQMLGTEGVVEYKTVALGPDGTRRSILVSRIPLKSPRGIVGALGLAFVLETGTSELAESPLTPRLHETLCLLARGLSTEKIAAELGVTRETARNYIRQLLRRLGAHSRLEAVVVAREVGLVPR